MSKYAFGVDVGGTTVKLGLFNDEGQVLDKWEIPTVKDNGGEKVLPDIAASIKNKMQEKNITAADLVGVGIGAPGAVNADGFMVGIQNDTPTCSMHNSSTHSEERCSLEILFTGDATRMYVRGVPFLVIWITYDGNLIPNL